MNLSQAHDLTFRYILQVYELVLFAVLLVAELLFGLFGLPLRKVKVVKIEECRNFWAN